MRFRFEGCICRSFLGVGLFLQVTNHSRHNSGQIISETDKNEPLYRRVVLDKNGRTRTDKNNHTAEKASQRAVTNAKGVDKIFYKRSSPNKAHIQPPKGKRPSHHQYIFKFKSPDFPPHSDRMHFSARNSKINQTRGAVTSSRTRTKNAFIINIQAISSPVLASFQNSAAPADNGALVSGPSVVCRKKKALRGANSLNPSGGQTFY